MTMMKVLSLSASALFSFLAYLLPNLDSETKYCPKNRLDSSHSRYRYNQQIKNLLITHPTSTSLTKIQSDVLVSSGINASRSMKDKIALLISTGVTIGCMVDLILEVTKIEVDNTFSMVTNIFSTFSSNIFSQFSSIKQNVINNFFSHFSFEKQTMLIYEYEGSEKNRIYEAAEIYIRNKFVSSSNTTNFRTHDESRNKNIIVTQVFTDVYKAVKFEWRFMIELIKILRNEMGAGFTVKRNVRSLKITYPKKYSHMALESYIPYIKKEAETIRRLQ
ncbi:hypothetical protein RJT34_09507 [Clitoria ternatea]|uniref:AAA-type ATPase N-terminal domain-containing protein n=1 Tax=Clitoria ternatea TaxID=43366 RepID=A0AAN9K8A5_CLITE